MSGMAFCPNCGSTLRVQRKQGGVLYSCIKCSYVEAKGSQDTQKGSNLRPQPKRLSPEIVVTSGESGSTLPTTKAVCPSCGNGEAYWWMQQTRSADEATTRFLRCTGCGRTWREYD